MRSNGAISPDGKWLGWMAPHEGVMNVFVAPFGKPDDARRMTGATERPIPFFSFARDSASILYIQDKAGDENFLLYQVDLASGEERTLTPFENTRVRVIGSSHRFPDKLLVALNNRDPHYHDAYMLDLKSGALELVLRNDSYVAEWRAFHRTLTERKRPKTTLEDARNDMVLARDIAMLME